MRFIIAGAALTVLLSACGTTSATPHRTQVSQNLHSPTAAPHASVVPPNKGNVLLDVKGSAEDTTTKAFAAGSTWKAHYTFQCMMNDPVFRHGVLQIYGIDPKHPNGQETIILYALTEQKVNTGITAPVSAGNYKLRILADPVCSWHVVVRTV